METRRKNTSEYVEAFLSLAKGESVTFPLTALNTIRGLRFSNPRVLEARADGKEFSVRTDIKNRQTVLVRTA